MRAPLPLLVAIAALAGAAACAHAQQITYGPILGRGATPDKMIVKWGTSSANDPTSVSFRPKGGAFQTVTGPASRDHEVVLTGLAIDSAFDYYVTSGAAKSSTFSFATCPTAAKPMDVVFYGDSRSDPTEHAKVVTQVIAKAPEMVFESGDIYVDGSYAGYLSEFFPATKALVATTPFMAAPGNHDATSPLASNYGLVFPSPKQQPADPWHAYYAFRCGNSHFIALDSNAITDATQLTFLKGQLAAAKADGSVQHVFVWFHHSAYSTGSGHGDNTTVQQTWVPLFEAPGSKVTAVFSGHDHIYERLADKSQVVYVVSGGAGAPPYTDTNVTAATKLKFYGSYNFVKVHIEGGLTAATAYDDSGAQIDSWSVGQIGGGGNDGGAPPDLATGGGGGGDLAAGSGGDLAMMGGGGNPDAASSTGGSQGGGCAVGGHASPSGLGLGLLALLLLAARRRSIL